MHELARELNETINQACPAAAAMLSTLGREIYFPRGIMFQSAEAKKQAKAHNATIGTAREGGQAMHLPLLQEMFSGFAPDDVFNYAPSGGLPELRQAWQDEIRRKNPALPANAGLTRPVVAGGVTHALSLAAELFLDPGDWVLLADRYWENYDLIFNVRRETVTVDYPLFKGEGLDTAAFARRLEAAGTERQKLAVLVNFPQNPTGYAPTTAEAEALAAALRAQARRGTRLVVLCDDSYFGLNYESEVYPQSLFALLAGREENLLAVKLDGATKEMFVWGFRVGFVTLGLPAGAKPELAAALEEKLAGLVRGGVSNCPRPSQAMILKALKSPDLSAQLAAKRETLARRAAKIKSVLAEPRYAGAWTPYPFNSGYFMCLRLNGVDGEAYRRHLLASQGVGLIACGGPDVRVAFSCVEEDDIPDLFDRMHRAWAELREKKS